ncbi:MAG: endonuclease/exonuclease/phosphatase family protein [Candidatus Omnitrophota bacterium]
MTQRRRIPSKYFPWIFFWLALSGPVLGWLGRWSWFFDLFSHFRLQQIGFLVMSLPFLAWWKKRALLALIVIMILIAGTPLLVYWPGSAPSPAGSSATIPVRVIYANVNVANRDYDTIVSVLMKGNPDVLIISEISAPLYEALKPHLKEYPYREAVLRDDCFGLGVFSRLPAVSTDVRFLGEARVPSIRCVIKHDSKEFVLWATHPTPPMGQRVWTWRNDQLKALVREILPDPRPHIVAGDLNMAPWCYWFGMFQTVGLKDSAQGKGIVPTWPFYAPSFLRIPLDHILVSENIPVIRRDILSLPGSDHRPVSVIIGL